MKIQFKLTGLLLALVLCGIAAAEPSNSGNWNPLSNKYSFHSLINSDSDDRVKPMLSSQCVDSIRRHIADGKTFHSDVLEKYTLPISEFNNWQTKTGLYYHYTNAPAMQTIAKKNTPEEIFKFLRVTNFKSSLPGDLAMFFYVATDPSSSKWAGSILIKSELPPHTLALIAPMDLPGKDPDPNSPSRKIEQDLLSAHPNLAPCKKDTVNSDILVFLAAEHRKIGLIAYYGIDNSLSNQRREQWFQVLGSWAIQGMSVEKN